MLRSLSAVATLLARLLREAEMVEVRMRQHDRFDVGRRAPMRCTASCKELHDDGTPPLSSTVRRSPSSTRYQLVQEFLDAMYPGSDVGVQHVTTGGPRTVISKREIPHPCSTLPRDGPSKPAGCRTNISLARSE